jgi:hypothetical protein
MVSVPAFVIVPPFSPSPVAMLVTDPSPVPGERLPCGESEDALGTDLQPGLRRRGRAQSVLQVQRA